MKLRMLSAKRFALLRSIQRQFDELVETFPTELRAAIIRPYDRDDFDSPGRLSLMALPFWVGERLSVPHQASRDMAVGNLFLLHCFQSFDFIVDGDRPDTSNRAQVVLGNLCYLQVLRHYQPYFPAGSSFWKRMEKYWYEWGESILWEVEEIGTRRPIAEKHLQRAAHKAAALKICPTGLALLAGQPDLIPILEQSVDLMHTIMQLVDDLKDWREDLQHHRYNAFLGLLAADQHMAGGHMLTQEDVAEAFGSDVLERYVRVIRDYADRARTRISTLGIEPWAGMIDRLVGDATQLKQRYIQWLEMFQLERLTP